jgi:superfamily II helicase
MNPNEIASRLKLMFENSPEELSINVIVSKNLAQKVNFIKELMLAENQDYTEEEIYKFILWNGANKILEEIADNAQVNNN